MITIRELDFQFLLGLITLLNINYKPPTDIFQFLLGLIVIK
ncbi:hypothetical protein J5U22_01643 [Saccharolobus shibatae]|uniref:Uncharacterized protein n=1 Tax=Saccharolobus shibatae TaxID=2286 RepID=A0A8F5C134_9CREN|nr:hypothetical protein J5U22_01643 [Saccharolobus shibatae]